MLGLWEGWFVWTGDVHGGFMEGFVNPPMKESEKMEEEKGSEERNRFKAGDRWKSVGGHELAGEGGEDVDGREMVDDDEMDGVAMAEEELIDEDLDGVPMMDSSDEEMVDAPAEEQEQVPVNEEVPPPPPAQEQKKQPPPPVSIGRQRPRAMDMFADDSD